MIDGFRPPGNVSGASASSREACGAESATNSRAIEDAPSVPDASCVVCLADSTERSVDWVFKGCGHRCLCKPCARKLREKASSDVIECPMCRQTSTVVPLKSFCGHVFSAAE